MRDRTRPILWLTLLLSLAAAPARSQVVNVSKSIEPAIVGFGQTVTVCIEISGAADPKADIAWVLDITGSMSAAINNIRNNINTFTAELATRGIDYQNAIVGFRDVNNPDSEGENNCLIPPFQVYDFTSDDTLLATNLVSLSITGGGDIPESALEAMEVAAFPATYCSTPYGPLSWRPDATRTMILVTDASVHSTDYDGYSALSILDFPVSLMGLGYSFHVVSNNPTFCGPTCGPATIAGLTGGTWLPLGSSPAAWNGFMTTLGNAVGQLTNVRIHDPLPPDLAPLPGGSPGVSVVGNDVYFDIASINFSDMPVSYCFPAMVTSGSPDFIENNAELTADGVTLITSNSVSIWNTGPTPTSSPTCVPLVWPNPFNPKHAVDGVLKVGCVPDGGEFSIYTLAGELVWTGKPSPSFQYGSPLAATWNGRNEKGVPVATGIYFYVVRKEDEVLHKGKFLVLGGP